jgi:hypothetical protein
MNPNLTDENNPDPMLIVEAGFPAAHRDPNINPPYRLKQEIRGT